jgi:hypothetical protein
MAHEAYKRRFLTASSFRGLCEIAREIYWSTKDPVIREKAMSYRWKATQVDAELQKLHNDQTKDKLSHHLGKASRSNELCNAITASRQRLFDEENHKGMKSEEYLTHLEIRDSSKSIYDTISELYAVTHDERLIESEYMASRMLAKITEYQERKNT